jgi:hypothetical protein
MLHKPSFKLQPYFILKYIDIVLNNPLIILYYINTVYL